VGWIELIKIGPHAKFQLKRTNGVRVMAFQSFAKNGYVWANFLKISFFQNGPNKRNNISI
jgi:hypothetical protein